MSAPAFAWAFEKGHELGLTSSQLVLLLYMADQANGQGWFFTGYARMAKYTRLCVRTIHYQILELVRLGLIRAEHRPGKPTIYYVLRQPLGDAATAAHATAASQANGATPATTARVTPATAAQVSTPDVCNSQQPPLQPVPPTPATTAPYPSSTQEETLKREGAGSKDREAGKEAGKQADPSPPSPNAAPPKAPVLGAIPGGNSQSLVQPRPSSDAWLDKPSADDALPKARASRLDVERGEVISGEVPEPDEPVDPAQFKALIAAIACGFKNNYPPRAASMSADDQITTLVERPRDRAFHLAGDQLAAARAQLRARVPA